MSSKNVTHVRKRGKKLSLRKKTTDTECSVISGDVHDVPSNNATKTNDFPSVLHICKKDENQQVSSSPSTRATQQANNRPTDLTRSQSKSSFGDQSRIDSGLRSAECNQIKLPELPPWYGLKEKEEDKWPIAETITIGDISLEWLPLPTHCQKCLFRSKHKRAAQLKQRTSTVTAHKSSSLLENGKPHKKNDPISDSTILNQKTNLAINHQTDISLLPNGRLNVNAKESNFVKKNSPEISPKNKSKVTSVQSRHSDVPRTIVGQSLPQTSSASSSKKQTQFNRYPRSPSPEIVVISVGRERSENESHRTAGTKRTLTDALANDRDRHQNAAKRPRLTDSVAGASRSLAAELKPKPVSMFKCSGNQMKQPAASQKNNAQTRLDSMLVRNSTTLSPQTSAKTLQTSGKSVVPNKASSNRQNPNSSNQATAQTFPVQGRKSLGAFIASNKSTPLASNAKPLFKKRTSEQVTGFVGDTQTARSKFCTMKSQPPRENTSTITTAAVRPENRLASRQYIRPIIRQNPTVHSPAKSAFLNKPPANKHNTCTSSRVQTEFRKAGEVGPNRTVFPQQDIQTTAGNALTASTSGYQSKADRISYQYLGQGSHTHHQQTTSKKSEIIQSCPLCLFEFPTSWTSFQRDSHIAVCLSKSSDDATW